MTISAGYAVRLAAASMLIVMLGACGLKGDLYLAEEQPAPATTPQTNAPDDDAGGDEIDEEPEDGSSRTPSR